jgi:hypothetical protein
MTKPVQHPQRLAQGIAADAQHLRKRCLRRQRLAGAQPFRLDETADFLRRPTANRQSADGRLMALTVPAITEHDIGAATPKPEVSWADCSASFEPFSTGTHGVARELAFLNVSPVLPAWRHHWLRGHWTCRACAASWTTRSCWCAFGVMLATALALFASSASQLSTARRYCSMIYS